MKFLRAKRHLHPMFVHFPIAFLMAATLFYLLYFFLLYPSLKTTSTHLLVLGTISSPFAIATGLLTWWINYRLKFTLFIKLKILFSVFLLAIEVILILFWIGEIEISYHIYLILMILFTPIVILLGYYGGRMTFPAEK